MGQTYYVVTKLEVERRNELIKAVQKYMSEAKNVDFGNYYKPDSLDNIIRIFLAAQQNGLEIEGDEYTSFFDASYGWESVLYDWFQTMVPYLKKGSYIRVEPDSGGWIEEVA